MEFMGSIDKYGFNECMIFSSSHAPDMLNVVIFYFLLSAQFIPESFWFIRLLSWILKSGCSSIVSFSV